MMSVAASPALDGRTGTGLFRMELTVKQRVALSFFAVVAVVLAAATAYAAKPSTPKARLETDATHIIVGKVRSISSSRKIGW